MRKTAYCLSLAVFFALGYELHTKLITPPSVQVAVEGTVKGQRESARPRRGTADVSQIEPDEPSQILREDGSTAPTSTDAPPERVLGEPCNALGGMVDSLIEQLNTGSISPLLLNHGDILLEAMLEDPAGQGALKDWFRRAAEQTGDANSLIRPLQSLLRVSPDTFMEFFRDAADRRDMLLLEASFLAAKDVPGDEATVITMSEAALQSDVPGLESYAAFSLRGRDIPEVYQGAARDVLERIIAKGEDRWAVHGATEALVRSGLATHDTGIGVFEDMAYNGHTFVDRFQGLADWIQAISNRERIGERSVENFRLELQWKARDWLAVFSALEQQLTDDSLMARYYAVGIARFGQVNIDYGLYLEAQLIENGAD